MVEQLAFNMDCMEAMRNMKDNEFDLAIVDPPYGAGFTEGGGCKGRFAKYHQDSSQTVQVEREREREREQSRISGTDSASDSTDTRKVSRTGGGWSKQYDQTKKSSRGT